VIEAMAAGTPVVISDDPALVETGGEAVLAVSRGDAEPLARALRRLEDDVELRRDLVNRGRDRVVGFSDRAFGEAMWQLYADL
jgi:glycosyltransferase involved in cell wall biosynthesis